MKSRIFFLLFALTCACTISVANSCVYDTKEKASKTKEVVMQDISQFDFTAEASENIHRHVVTSIARMSGVHTSILIASEKNSQKHQNGILAFQWCSTGPTTHGHSPDQDVSFLPRSGIRYRAERSPHNTHC